MEPNVVHIVELMGRIIRHLKGSIGIQHHDALRFSDLAVLWALQDHAPARPADIVQRAGLPNSTLTGILDRLEEQGFIERVPAPADRRSLLVQLTPKYKALREEIHAQMQKRVAEALAGMDPAKLEQLEEGLTAVWQHLQDKVATTEEAK